MNSGRLPVVAGVDGSAESLAAAEYAAATAARRRSPVHLVYGYRHPMGYGALGYSPYSPGLGDAREAAGTMLRGIVETVRAGHPGVDVTGHEVASDGSYALVNASSDAQLVVVGCRGVGGFAELLLGSVSAQVAAHAHCPVIVLRPHDPRTEALPPDAPVMVGIDGSPGGVPAVEFAFVEAAARAVPLVAVHAYLAVDGPARPEGTRPEDTGPQDTDPDAAARRAADGLLAETVTPWATKYPQVSVEMRAVHSFSPEYSMVEASRAASLMAVGSRGRGGFAGLLLGSVSQALVHHGHCPVAVVRPVQAR